MKETIHRSEAVTVTYEGMDFSKLPAEIRSLLGRVVRTTAFAVERGMKLLIVARGFVDTRATVNSVAVTMVDDLNAEIGPSTEYAPLGEYGWTQTHVYGRRLKVPIIHAGLYFARDALENVRAGFVQAVEAALKRVG